MPRPLIFGSQSLLLAVDRRHRIRDLTYPYPGELNHLSGKAVAWGIWVDGGMSWVDSPDWEITLGYRPGTQVAECLLVNRTLGLEVTTTEACHPTKDQAVRIHQIRSLIDRARDIKVFWNHEIGIDESPIGNTAVYHPDLGGIVHYKRNVFLGFFARHGSLGPDQWSCGVRVRPEEGSWRQCQTGHLNGQSAEVGTVDSTMGISLHLEPWGTASFDWAVAAADSFEALELVSADLFSNGLGGVIGARADYDEARLADLVLPDEIEGLPQVQEAARRALLTIDSMTSRGGAIIAGCDSDIMGANTLNYCNVWPRDGSLVADALMDAGDSKIPPAWLRWCEETSPDESLFLQKQWPSGARGVSWHPLFRRGNRVQPVQLDETSLTLSLACRWAEKNGGSTAWIESKANAILAYLQPNGLPQPSWDLWEERRGVSFFAVCTTIAALEAASAALNRAELAEAAEKMRQSALRLMIGDDGSFVRELDEEGHQDGSADSALVAALLQGVFDWSLPCVAATVDKVRRILLDRSPSGGCARYDRDYYHRQSDSYPGSPWLISTLWLAQAEIKGGGSRKEALRLTRWAMERREPSGLLPESCHPETGEPLSISPLAWSHAELLRTLCLLSTSDKD
jgi:GH15 family glucan-1,4-alpha-glucosidase